MSWYELITTHGQWLRNVRVSVERGEFKVSWVKLNPGEEAAILIDRLKNLAYISKPFDECQLLAWMHGYELWLSRQRGETPVEQLERLFGLDAPRAQ